MGVAFHISAFLISVSCLVFTFIQNRYDKPQKKIYMVMVAILVLNTVSEAAVEFAVPFQTESVIAQNLILVSKYFYFVLHAAVLPLLVYYVLRITGRSHRFTLLKHALFLIPVAVVEVLMLTNPLHHWCYYYEPVTFAYHRGWGVTALYVISVFYIAFFIGTLFSSWKAITQKRRLAMSYFLVMVIAGILVQMVLITARVELLAEAVAFLGVLLTVEDEGDLIDSDAGIYNRKAMRIDLGNLIANKQSFKILCVKVENAGVIRRATGSDNTDILASMLYRELVSIVPRYLIYRTAPDTFALILVGKHRASAEEAVHKLEERFKKGWSCNHSEVILSATIMLATVPEDIMTAEDAFNMTDGMLPLNHKKLLIGKEDLSYLIRRRMLERAIQQGLTQGGFEVYYQPTFDADGLRLVGVEALARLNDPQLGQLMPDEFIPLAEQIGLIGELDDYVLYAACEFVTSGVPARIGIQSINVNLSVVQCIKPGFVEHIISIVDEAGVDHARINFEITESVDANDYAAMSAVINGFRQNGFRVYMDDYGTGFSNLRSLFSMDFNVIKIDKSLLWGAQESDLGRVILENNVRMLKQMDVKILVEGVETQEQIALLKELGVDYLQGFYFSKPVPENELISQYKYLDVPAQKQT